MQNYQFYDLGKLKGGETVEIKMIGNSANVRLMNEKNYRNYTVGQSYKFVGGLATQSPVRLSIPEKGHWFVVVDMQGLQGTVNVSVSVIGV